MTHEFAVGDIVTVVRRVDREHGWDNVWVDKMNDYIGHSGEILQFGGAGVEIVGGFFLYPPSSLELARNQLEET